MVLILVAAASFGLGRQSIITSTMAPARNEATVVTATTKPEAAATTIETPLPSTYYVASKNGQVYHLPHCSGAKNISEANKITFTTKEEAEAAGYRPAANCKGI